VVPACDTAGEFVNERLELRIGNCTVKPCSLSPIRYFVDIAMTCS
jgi:hypothetical protein